MNKKVIDRMSDNFMQEFSTIAGCLCLFVVAQNAPDPDEVISKVFAFWEKQKKPMVNKVIEHILEVRANPEKFDDYENLVFGEIDPEDYQLLFQKALAETKKEVFELFREFKERNGN